MSELENSISNGKREFIKSYCDTVAEFKEKLVNRPSTDAGELLSELAAMVAEKNNFSFDQAKLLTSLNKNMKPDLMTVEEFMNCFMSIFKTVGFSPDPMAFKKSHDLMSTGTITPIDLIKNLMVNVSNLPTNTIDNMFNQIQSKIDNVEQQ